VPCHIDEKIVETVSGGYLLREPLDPDEQIPAGSLGCHWRARQARSFPP
jgi:hypothetical protein